MYTTGRGTKEFGTILPAILEWKRDTNLLGKISMIGTNGKNSEKSKLKALSLFKMTGIELDLEIFPKISENNPKIYKQIIRNVKQPACAIVVVPDHLHFKVTSDCLRSGLHVLVAKPLTPTLEEGRKLVTLAKKQNLHSIVEFHKRWDKVNIMLRDNIQSGRLGKLLYCQVEYSQRKSIPTKYFKSWAEKTSILQYLGVHYLDIIRYTTGAKPIRVMATGQKKFLVSKGIDSFDSIQCIIEWELPSKENFTQTLLTNWIDPETSSAMSNQKIKIVGTKGNFESDQKDRGLKINFDNENFQQPNPYFCQVFQNELGKKEWHGYGIDSIKTFLNDVTNIFENQSKVIDFLNKRPTFEEALISTSIIESAHKSLKRNNEWIKI